jgi:acetyl-CoA synthetase
LTYENQAALNKVGTRWKSGRDVWWQVCQRQTS